MEAAILTFVIAFALILIVGLISFFRQTTRRRLSKVVVEVTSVTGILRDATSPRLKMARLVEWFQRLMPRSPEEVDVLQKRLTRAGYRERTHVNVFYGAKVLTPAVICALAAVTGAYAVGGWFSFVIAAGLGFLVPDFWLGNRIKKRQTNLRLGLPDALDLIIICVEAGLGVDRAVLRTVEELRLSEPEVADELTLVSLAQSSGRTRADAWKSLGERTGVESVRTLASILIQADKFGTSVGKALRAHAETLRTRRRMDAEEQAAKTTVKLIFPLVLFIFPALFVVTLGPSMIIIMEQMKNLLD
jgi:tight adherence protein C